MKKTFSIIVILVAGLSACKKNNGNPEACIEGANSFLEMNHQTEGNINSGTTGISSATLLRYNTADQDTLVVNFGYDNGNVYSFQAGVVNPGGTGTYTFGNLTNIVLVWNNTFGSCYDLTLNIEEYGSPVTNAFNPNAPFINEIRGTFTGRFAWSGPDTVTYTGSFCHVLPE